MKIEDFASPTQLKYFKALKEYGSQRRAAKALGVHRSSLGKSLRRLRKAAEIRGFSPDYGYTHPVPESYVVKGISQYVDADGKVKAQWVKSDLREQAYLESIKEAVTGFVEGIKPAKVDDLPKMPSVDTDVIPWFQIGDAHFGMLAHAAETGANFDMKIAKRELVKAFSMLFEQVGPHERCVINDLGDFTHIENFSGTTEAGGNPLDFDVRFPKMITLYSRLFRSIIDMALDYYKYVDVIINQGNHSRTNDIWMSELIRIVYGPSGRVSVLDNSSVFISYKMGNTLVLVHHGDKCPDNRLANVMVSDFRKDFGDTEYHYIDKGHIHTRTVSREYGNISIESFNQLAPRDKWAHDKGFRSRSSMVCVLRSRSYGEIGRILLPVEKVHSCISGKPASLFSKTSFVA